MSFLSEREDVLQWAFKLNSALVTADTWDLNDCSQNVNASILRCNTM